MLHGRCAIYFFVLILLINIVSSMGEIKHIDINRGQTINVDLKVKDGVEFNLMNDRHIINVNKITPKGADLDVFNFVDGDQKISYITVNKRQLLKLDFDKDGRGELYVKFNKFLPNGVSLDFYYPAEEDFPSSEVTGDTVKEINPVKNQIDYLRFSLVLVGVLVVILLIILGVNLNKIKKVKTKK